MIGVLAVLAIGTTLTTNAPSPASEPSPQPAATDRAPSSGPAIFTDSAIVWVSKDAMNRGRDLLSSGAYQANPQLLIPHIACIVEPGVAATVIRIAGMGVREIAVDDGPRKGCTGVVEMERLRRP